MSEVIHKSYIEDHILLLEIDNPPANSLSKKIKIQFGNILDEIEGDSKLRAIILTGRGDKFCCGDDLKEAHANAQLQEGILINLRAFGNVISRFEKLPIPTIAACNGWTIGGGLELALCCDIRIAATEAKFKGVAVNIGLTASGSRLPKVIGLGRSKYMLLTANAIDSETALSYGLISEIHSKERLQSKAIELAKLIATKAPLAVKSTKQIINKSTELSENEMNFYGQEELERLSKTKDYRIALEAFLNKKIPEFKGE